MNMKYSISTLCLLLFCFITYRASAQCTYPKGTDILKGSVFQGSFNAGTAADPDIVCAGKKIIYELKPPTGFTNSQFGATWVITNLTFKSANGTTPKDTVLGLPSAATGNGKLSFTPRPAYGDSTYVLIASIRTLTSNCDTILIRYVYVAPLPVVSFLPSANLICLGENISFSNSTSGSNLSYLWDFGDGSKTTTKSPIYSYTSPGTYKVWLKATNTNGCVDSAYETVVVTPYPKPNFSPSKSNACLGQSIVFTNTSTDVSLASYEYRFGDDSVSFDENPTHTYAAAGTYKVWLIVTNGAGCTDSINKTITVSNPPSVGFSGTDVCLGSPSVFTNSSSTGTGITYLWKFDDGKTSTDANPTHTFTTKGRHGVILYVSAAGGCTDSTSDSVMVNSITVDFAASVVAGCTPVNVDFNDNTKDEASRLWTFDNGDTTSSRNPTRQFTSVGTHTAKLVVTSTAGCKDSATKTIIVYGQPDPGFSFDTTGLSATFTADDQTSGNSYSWDFGDGKTSTDKNPTHTYDTTGKYKVTLKVTNGSGCDSTSSDSVSVVKPIPPGIKEGGLAAMPVNVYPNPFAGEFNLSYELENASAVSIKIYNMQGKLVMEKNTGRQLAGKHTITVKEELPAGSYVVRIVTDKAVGLQQVIHIAH
jgi:PKD repeat protein